MSARPTTPPHITRRNATKLLGGALISTLVPSSLAQVQPAAAAQPTYSRLLSDEDLTFLEEMQHAACLFFCEQVDPASGQVLDADAVIDVMARYATEPADTSD